MSEEIDYKELFGRMQIENEILKSQLQFAPPVSFSFPSPSFSWITDLYESDPLRFLYIVFLAGYVLVISLQCAALIKEIRS